MQEEDQGDSHEVVVTEKVEEREKEQQFETDKELDTDDEMPELVDMDYESDTDDFDAFGGPGDDSAQNGESRI